MTKNTLYRQVIEGAHVMSNQPADGLRDYWTVQAIKSASRRKESILRLVGVRNAVRNYRVMVNLTSDERVRIFNPESKAEVIL